MGYFAHGGRKRDMISSYILQKGVVGGTRHNEQCSQPDTLASTPTPQQPHSAAPEVSQSSWCTAARWNDFKIKRPEASRVGWYLRDLHKQSQESPVSRVTSRQDAAHSVHFGLRHLLLSCTCYSNKTSAVQLVASSRAVWLGACSRVLFIELSPNARHHDIH